jgi:hypothetical protein
MVCPLIVSHNLNLGSCTGWLFGCFDSKSIAVKFPSETIPPRGLAEQRCPGHLMGKYLARNSAEPPALTPRALVTLFGFKVLVCVIFTPSTAFVQGYSVFSCDVEVLHGPDSSCKAFAVFF